MQEHGLYIISEQFFRDFPDPYLRGNKGGNRPHYYAFRDKTSGLFWMIPLSSRVGKYSRIIENRKQRNLPTDTLFICDIGTGKQSVFQIGDMFPVTAEYIERAYTVGSIPLVLKNDVYVTEIEKRSQRVLNLLHHGVSFSPTQPDVLSIEKKLLRQTEFRL